MPPEVGKELQMAPLARFTVEAAGQVEHQRPAYRRQDREMGISGDRERQRPRCRHLVVVASIQSGEHQPSPGLARGHRQATPKMMPWPPRASRSAVPACRRVMRRAGRPARQCSDAGWDAPSCPGTQSGISLRASGLAATAWRHSPPPRARPRPGAMRGSRKSRYRQHQQSNSQTTAPPATSTVRAAFMM